MKTAWRKWKEISAVICDRKISVRLRLKLYRTIVRPVLLYGAEMWAIRKEEERLLERTEMRMLRWILGISLREHLNNDEIRNRAGVVSIIKKVEESRLRWFGHIMRMDDEEIVKKAVKQDVTGKRSRGRQRVRWSDGVNRSMLQQGLREEDAEDRRLWRSRTRWPDP